MQYKKIYIEITNNCNLSCSFCAKTKRNKKFMTTEEFEIILDKIKDYTKYIYLHVMGEPLLHPEVNEFIKLAYNKGFFVNITTNGTLLEKIQFDTPIRQINISLHSLKEHNKINIEDIINKSEKLARRGVYINYRVWRSECLDIINYLEKRYNVIISKNEKSKTLTNNIFFSSEKEFIWPEKKREEGNLSPTGTCRALRDHLAILVDGTIVPCCLDNDASIILGNIFYDSLSDVINTPLFMNMLKGFKENKKIHPLCQNCNFYEKN